MPLLIRVPGVTDVAGYVHDTPALLDLVDVGPTVSALAGLELPKGVDGIDQSSVVLGTTAAGIVAHGDHQQQRHHAMVFPRNASYHQYPACGMNGVLNTTRKECNQVKAAAFDFMGGWVALVIIGRLIDWVGVGVIPCPSQSHETRVLTTK